MRILIVEDEKEMAEGIRGILQKAGYETDMAGDGLLGMELILNRHYDLILLDLMLPKVSGLRVLESIREKGVVTPVIILTAKSQTEDKIRGLDCGADDYLIKPFDAGELLARIRARVRNYDGENRDVVNAYDIQIDMEHIFDRFYTTDLSRHGGSFGLGLAIAKAIVSRHDGTITVTSKKEEGTAFLICFHTHHKK